MLFIHGGGLYLGSASEEMYVPDILAAKGDIVTVNINYRLNIFGMLYMDTEDAPGI